MGWYVHFLPLSTTYIDRNTTETFETNVTAGFFVSAAFLPLLARGTANNKGYSASIVNVASISGMMRGSSSGQFAYAASKAAALHLSKMLGTTLAQAKVSIYSLPSPFVC
jgi:NAD(P)-dependent dehydrogenase (short-subunit alcohol dehydrogenase family)